MSSISILPPGQMIDTTVSLPGSKSIANRGMIMAALGAQAFDEPAAGASDDVTAMYAALESEAEGTVDVGPAGTAMRFLTAYYASKPGADVTLTGSERMLHRPIGPLVDALRESGADIEYVGAEGFPPLRIAGTQLHGGEIDIDATISSQFISALLMVAPTMTKPLTVHLKGRAVSVPYVDLTLAMMRRRGIDAERSAMDVTVRPSSYSTPTESDDEGDWSAASYWYEIAALSAGFVTLTTLRDDSLQPDRRVQEIFGQLGVITTFTDRDDNDNYIGPSAQLAASPEVFGRMDFDMASTPDLVPAVVVTACLSGVPFRLEGVANLRIKETDRIEALITEMAKLSFRLYADGTDAIVWDGDRLPVTQIEPLDTYGDHRMALALAPVAIFIPGIVIRDPETVTKSYPAFWDHLTEAGFEIKELTE